MYTLGINAVYHDSAACLVKNGYVLAAVEEERFTRIKHGKRPIPFSTYELPFHAINYCLQELPGLRHAMPCCMVSTPDRINFGNISELGAEGLWNGPHYQEFRKQLSSDEPPEVCRSCSVYKGIF